MSHPETMITPYCISAGSSCEQKKVEMCLLCGWSVGGKTLWPGYESPVPPAVGPKGQADLELWDWAR